MGHGTWTAGRGQPDGVVDAGRAAGAGTGAAGDVGHVAAAAAAAGSGRRRGSPWAAGRDESIRAAGHSGSGWDTRRVG